MSAKVEDEVEPFEKGSLSRQGERVKDIEKGASEFQTGASPTPLDEFPPCLDPPESDGSAGSVGNQEWVHETDREGRGRVGEECYSGRMRSKRCIRSTSVYLRSTTAC